MAKPKYKRIAHRNIHIDYKVRRP